MKILTSKWEDKSINKMNNHTKVNQKSFRKKKMPNSETQLSVQHLVLTL